MKRRIGLLRFSVANKTLYNHVSDHNLGMNYVHNKKAFALNANRLEIKHVVIFKKSHHPSNQRMYDQYSCGKMFWS